MIEKWLSAGSLRHGLDFVEKSGRAADSSLAQLPDSASEILARLAFG